MYQNFHLSCSQTELLVFLLCSLRFCWCLEYIASNGKVVMNNKYGCLEGHRRGLIEAISSCFPVGTEGNHRNGIKMNSASAEI